MKYKWKLDLVYLIEHGTKERKSFFKFMLVGTTNFSKIEVESSVEYNCTNYKKFRGQKTSSKSKSGFLSWRWIRPCNQKLQFFWNWNRKKDIEAIVQKGVWLTKFSMQPNYLPEKTVSWKNTDFINEKKSVTREFLKKTFFIQFNNNPNFVNKEFRKCFKIDPTKEGKKSKV